MPLGPTPAARPALWDLEVCLRGIRFRRSSGPSQASVAPCPDVLGPGIGQTGMPASLLRHPTPGHRTPLPGSLGSVVLPTLPLQAQGPRSQPAATASAVLGLGPLQHNPQVLGI